MITRPTRMSPPIFTDMLTAARVTADTRPRQTASTTSLIGSAALGPVEDPARKARIAPVGAFDDRPAGASGPPQAAVQPPSMLRLAPVIEAASSRQRKRTKAATWSTVTN